MSTHEKLIYQYLTEARDEFLSKTHPAININAHMGLWILWEEIPLPVKDLIERGTNSQITSKMPFQILHNPEEEYFSVMTKHIASGGYGEVKYIAGYFQLNHQSKEAFWKREKSAVKCILVSSRCTLSSIENEWNHLSHYSEKAKENNLVSPEPKPLLYFYTKNKSLVIFMRMRYTGKDLITWNNENDSIEDSFSIAIKVLELIQFLHKNSIVHRDLKLDNITIDEKGNLCAIDFGFSGNVEKHSQLKGAVGTSIYKNSDYMAYILLNENLTEKKLPLSTTEDLGSTFAMIQDIMNVTFSPFFYELNLLVYKKQMVLHKLTKKRAIPEGISLPWIMEILFLFYDFYEKYIPLDEMIHRLTIISENFTPPEKKTFISKITSFNPFTEEKKEFISEFREALLKTKEKTAFTKVILSALRYLRSLKLTPEKSYEMVIRMDIMAGFVISTNMFWLYNSYYGYLSYRHMRAHLLTEKYLLQPSQQNLQELFRYPVLKNMYLCEKLLGISSPHQHSIQFLINLEKRLNDYSVNEHEEMNRLFVHIRETISTSNISLASFYNRLSLLEHLFHNYMTMHPHGRFAQNEEICTLRGHQEELESQREAHPFLYNIFRYIISSLMRRLEILRENSFIMIDEKTREDVGDDKILSKMENDIKNRNIANIETLSKKQDEKIKNNIDNSKPFSKEQKKDLWNSITDLLNQITTMHAKENPSLYVHNAENSSASSYSIGELYREHGFKAKVKGKEKSEEQLDNTASCSYSNGYSKRL